MRWAGRAASSGRRDQGDTHPTRGSQRTLFLIDRAAAAKVPPQIGGQGTY
jgi:hypothetical protein